MPNLVGLISEMTCYVSSGTLNYTQLLTRNRWNMLPLQGKKPQNCPLKKCPSYRRKQSGAVIYGSCCTARSKQVRIGMFGGRKLDDTIYLV